MSDPMTPTLPPHTRLILAAEDLLSMFGTRTEDGQRITAEWGEQKPEGWYEPTFTRTDDGTRLFTVDSLAAALPTWVDLEWWADHLCHGSKTPHDFAAAIFAAAKEEAERE